MSRLETFLPVIFASDKDGYAVDEAHTCSEYLFDIPFGGSFGANRQVVDDDIGTRIFEYLHDIICLTRRFGDDLREVLPKPIMSHTTINVCSYMGNVGEANGI